MAKALIGYMNSDLRTPARLVAENIGCAPGSANSNPLLLRLSEENDAGRQAVALIESASMQEMQPA